MNNIRYDKISNGEFTSVISESMRSIRERRKTIEEDEFNNEIAYQEFLSENEAEIEKIIKENFINLKKKIRTHLQNKTNENYLEFSKTRREMNEDLEHAYIKLLNNGEVNYIIQENMF
jgi:hypothetical protein